jgi:signal transduction histidine kinase
LTLNFNENKSVRYLVIDNLAGNAIKYTEPETTVKVGAKKAAGCLVIWVKDQGIGIRREELLRIFDEYATISSKPTADKSSHGLGLAIVKRMVELHGGDNQCRERNRKGDEIYPFVPFSLR